jgi:hypothetical protein
MLQEEFLKPLGLTAYRLAKDIGVPLTRIDYIVAGKRAVTAETQTVGSLTAPPKKQERPSRAFAFRGGQGGHSGFVLSPITSECPRSVLSIADRPQVAD